MKITLGIQNAFARSAEPGVRLEKITEEAGETRFTAWVERLGKTITVGCTGHLTPKQVEAEAGRIAAYLSALAPRTKAAPARDTLQPTT